jgi:nifR3 family TIM-barrel protein
MCRNPALLGKTLEAMVQSVQIPVTIKIRTGWDENSKNAHEVVRVAAESGVAWVAVHGRTRAQGYSGLADWDLIGDLKAKSTIPILGNGDITTPELAVERWKTYGVDAVLIGRGALRNPFIFEQALSVLKGEPYLLPTASRYIELIEAQQKMLHEVFNPKVAMLHARKFLAWYSSGFPGCHEFRSKLFSIPDPEQLWQESRTFFEVRTAHRDMQFLAQPFLMGGHG